MRPIFLCGFMGCGKSTVGKILAKKMGCQCVDLDKYIEDTATSVMGVLMGRKLAEKEGC